MIGLQSHPVSGGITTKGCWPRSPLLAEGGGAFAGACGRRQQGVSKKEQKGNPHSICLWREPQMPDTLEDLRTLEREVEREWWWLHGALIAVAELQADRERGALGNFRQMQSQARDVDRRRVQIAMRIAALADRGDVD